jgi:hypothetical protein
MIQPLNIYQISLLLTFLISGCGILPTHLHDSGKAASAAKLQSELAAYRENAPSMYQAMLVNLQKFKAEEDRLIVDLAVNREKALVTLLPTKNQKELETIKSEVKGRIDELESAITVQANRFLKEKGLIQKELSQVNSTIQKAKEAVAAAKADVTNWNQTVALLKKGIAELPSIVEQKTKEESVSDIGKILKDTGEKEVEFRDADQKIQKKKIREIIKDQIQAKGNDKSILSLPDAPGITLVILRFGLELAEIEQKSAVTRLTQLSGRAELYEDSLAEELLAKQLLSETTFGVAENIVVYHDLQRLAAAARAIRQGKSSGDMEASRDFFEKTNAIVKYLQDLRKLVLADSITARTKAMLKLTEARLDHEESIMLSRLNDEAWQALLKTGADGLLAYHHGGFTREDAANIIRIAQTIALGFIAGGVN